MVRKVIYKIKDTGLRLLIAPVLIGANSSYSKRVNCFYHGIGIIDSYYGLEEGKFKEITIAALSLIEKHDPRRFRIVCRELRYIIEDPKRTVSGRYFNPLKICFSNLSECRFDEHRDWYLPQYAGILIHEATHGRLHSKSFWYSKQTKERIERICEAEQDRFLRRLP
jgi:hypothetical protein